MRDQVIERLQLLGAEHLIDDLALFSEGQIQCCLEQLKQWTKEFAGAQKESWKERDKALVFEPFEECLNKEQQKIRLDCKKTAALLLGGGSGSRLGFESPKGCFPLLGKSLFERLCSKVAHKEMRLAILTSILNHAETVSFFEKQSWFGLQSKPHFFSQNTMPLLDDEGRWFWEAPGQIAAGADGNGSVFTAFEEAGLGKRFEEEGIEAIHILPVDNPLGDPSDPCLSSFHRGNDLSVICLRMEDPDEPMGRMVRRGHKLAIAEFRELNQEQRRRNTLANSGLLAIDLSLFRSLAKENLPLHWAYRTANHWRRGKQPAWKAERFIVDALSYAERAAALCYPREECFAPLKEKSSIPEIERLLMERDRRSMLSSQP